VILSKIGATFFSSKIYHEMGRKMCYIEYFVNRCFNSPDVHAPIISSKKEKAAALSQDSFQILAAM
jgi:hypothetical protein